MGALQQCVSSADVLPRMSDDAARSCLPGVPGIGWRAVQSQSKVLRSGTHCRFPSVKSQRGALVSVAKKNPYGFGCFFFFFAICEQPAEGFWPPWCPGYRQALTGVPGAGGRRLGPRRGDGEEPPAEGRVSSRGSAPTTRPRTGA